MIYYTSIVSYPTGNSPYGDQARVHIFVRSDASIRDLWIDPLEYDAGWVAFSAKFSALLPSDYPSDEVARLYYTCAAARYLTGSRVRINIVGKA